MLLAALESCIFTQNTSEYAQQICNYIVYIGVAITKGTHRHIKRMLYKCYEKAFEEHKLSIILL